MISSSSLNPPRQKQGVLTKIKMAAGFQPSSSSDTGKGRSKANNQVAHGFSLVEGRTSHPMEDYHVAEFKRVNEHELGLFAIFDGHLGPDVARYLQINLFKNILNQSEFWTDPVGAIVEGYKYTDNAILSHAVDLGLGGSTAVTAILIDCRVLYVANVGDSRAVICRGGDAIQLTVDHDPLSERKLVENKGGFVIALPGDVPRVDGQLAVARAFGDKNLKMHLSSDPDVHALTVDPADEFLILASDGLWKVMENQEAVNLIRKTRDPKGAAKQLTEEAVARKSKDDISCIVVRLR
eukprot:c27631_g1_i1 orf=517-1401(-)